MRFIASFSSAFSDRAAVTATATTAATILSLLTAPSAARAQVFFGKDLNGAGTTLPAASRPLTEGARADFLSRLTGVGTESFEGFADGQPAPLGLVFPGAGSATIIGNGNVRTGNNSGTYATDGSKFYLGNGLFTITFTDQIAAFGFTATDVGDITGDMTLTFSNNGSTVFTTTVPRIDTAASNGSALFFGYINTTALFNRVDFGNTFSQFDGFGFDQMTIGSLRQVTPVPEPSAWVAMGLAGVSVSGMILRTRRRSLRQGAFLKI